MKFFCPDTIACTLIFVFLTALFAITAFFLPEKYVSLTSSELIAGTVQMCFFSATIFFSIPLALGVRSRYWPSFVLLVLVLFLGLIGNITWGQEFFGLAERNASRLNSTQPTVMFFQRAVLPGEDWKIPVGLFWILYGLVFPLALRKGNQAAIKLERYNIAPPPLCLWPFYVSSAVLLQESTLMHNVDMAGVFLSFALAATALTHLVFYRYPIQSTADGEFPCQPRRVALSVTFLFYGIIILAAFGSMALGIKTNRESEYAGIMLESAAQYCRLEQQDKGISLYLKVLEGNPGDTSVLRRLAFCYREQGNWNAFMKYYADAVRFDLAKYRRHPENVPVNLSLAKTFMLRPDEEQVRLHLSKALENGRKQVHLDPENGQAAFRLGQAFLLQGEREEALIQLQKAVALNPDSSRYMNFLQKVRAEIKEPGSRERILLLSVSECL